MRASSIPPKPVSLAGQLGICAGASWMPLMAVFALDTPAAIRLLAIAAVAAPLIVVAGLYFKRRRATRA